MDRMRCHPFDWQVLKGTLAHDGSLRAFNYRLSVPECSSRLRGLPLEIAQGNWCPMLLRQSAHLVVDSLPVIGRGLSSTVTVAVSDHGGGDRRSQFELVPCGGPYPG